MISKDRSSFFNLKELERLGFFVKRSKIDLFVDYLHEFTANEFIKATKQFSIKDIAFNKDKQFEYKTIFSKFYVLKNSSRKEKEYSNNLFVSERILNPDFLKENKELIETNMKELMIEQKKQSDSNQRIFIFKRILEMAIKKVPEYSREIDNANEADPTMNLHKFVSNQLIAKFISYACLSKTNLFDPNLEKTLLFNKYGNLNKEKFFAKNLFNRIIDSIPLSSISNDNIDYVVNYFINSFLREHTWQAETFFWTYTKKEIKSISNRLENGMYLVFKEILGDLLGKSKIDRLEETYLNNFLDSICDKHNIDRRLSLKEIDDIYKTKVVDLEEIFKADLDSGGGSKFLTQEEIDALLDIAEAGEY